MWRHHFEKRRAPRQGGAEVDELSLGDRVRNTLTDDGKGVDAQPMSAAGLGLKIMGYRAQMIGATLGVEPGEDGGTVVRVVCPCRLGPGQGGGNDRKD